VRRAILDESPIAQVSNALVIGVLRTYLGQTHGVFPMNGNGIVKTIHVPELKKC
jgi:hypothetical protein